MGGSGGGWWWWRGIGGGIGGGCGVGVGQRLSFMVMAGLLSIRRALEAKTDHESKTRAYDLVRSE